MTKIKSLLEIEKSASVSETGKFVANLNSIIQLFNQTEKYNNIIRFDNWKNEMQVREFWGSDSWIQLEDHHVSIIRAEIQTEPKFARVSKSDVEDAIEVIGRAKMYDGALDYLNNLPEWDGTPRIDDFFIRACHVKADGYEEYYQAVGGNFFKAVIARLRANLTKGAKVDTVFVLEDHNEGSGKSRMFGVLAGKNIDSSASDSRIDLVHYESSASDLDSLNFKISTQGVMLLEFNEGVALKKAKEMNEMKSYITKIEDIYTGKWERRAKSHLRRFVNIMTTNDAEYLRGDDDRRFIPIIMSEEGEAIKHINLQYVFDNRDQLFAEALYRVIELKENWWKYPESMWDSIKLEKKVRGTWYDTISEWLNNPISVAVIKNDDNRFNNSTLADSADGIVGDMTDKLMTGVSNEEIWVHCIGGNIAHFDNYKKALIGKDLSLLGFERFGKRRLYRLPKDSSLLKNYQQKLEDIVF